MYRATVLMRLSRVIAYVIRFYHIKLHHGCFQFARQKHCYLLLFTYLDNCEQSLVLIVALKQKPGEDGESTPP